MTFSGNYRTSRLAQYLMAVFLAGAVSAHASQPNIIFIMADDLGYADVGVYGQQEIQTPSIDAIGQEGIRFTQFYSGATVCAPSRSALIEGKHTGHTRVRGNIPKNNANLLDSDVTFGEVLQEAGYVTGTIGKWGVGTADGTGHPNRQGFDYFYGFLDQGLAHDYYPEFIWENETRIDLNGSTYIHDEFTARAFDFISESAASEDPFFLYLAYTIPHTDIDVPSEAPYASEDWPEAERKYAAMVTRMDTDIGEMMVLLESLGIDDNTIVFFTSDNGPHDRQGHDEEFFDSNGLLRGLKRDHYEGGIRVPMVVRWPGRIAPGQVSDQIWAAWDVLPTTAALGGGQIPAGIDGINMLPALLGQEQVEQHDHLYWEFHEKGFHQAVRMGDWKAVRNVSPDELIEIYHLPSDPSESTNVAATHPEVVAQAAEIMLYGRTAQTQWPTSIDNPPPRYELEVRGGDGDGLFTAGTMIDVSADKAPAGQEFDRWLGDFDRVQNVTDPTTRFTMPAAPALLIATYREMPPETFELVVDRGNGDGDYTPGSRVVIRANEPGTGQMFERWIGSIDGLDVVDEPVSGFSMPARPAALSARYRDLPGEGCLEGPDFDADGIADACASEASAISGSWYDPASSGEGLMIHSVREDLAVAYFYGYDLDGSLLWLIATSEGPFNWNEDILFEVYDANGGEFQDFDPESVTEERWGQMTLVISDCAQSSVTLIGPQGEKNLSLQRLGQVAGTTCSGVSPREADFMTGSWYDEDRSGQGLVLQRISESTGIVYFYGYDRSARDLWLIGTWDEGLPEGESTRIEMLRAVGGTWEKVDPDQIEERAWGTLDLRIDGCSGGSAVINGLDGFQALSLTQLAGTFGLECYVPQAPVD